jgi:hypothetical protein
MNTKLKNLLRSRPAAFVFPALALALFAFPSAGRADEESEEKGRRAGFQIEIFGGAAAFDPSDLNRFVDYDNRIQAFFYDSYLDFKTRSGDIRTWGVRRRGERLKIKTGLPFGLRLRYRWNGSLSVSLGLKYVIGRRSSEIQYDYVQTANRGDLFTESGAFAPYTLSASGWAPLAGLHWTHRLSSALSVEASLAAGPLFARCRYLNDWTYKLTIQEYVSPTQGMGAPYEVFGRAGSLEEEGAGTGLALEAGLRLDWSWGGRWGVFAEAGYARQKAAGISGHGREDDGLTPAAWDGAWALQSEEISTYWGDARLTFPTNRWPAGSESRRAGDFALDLSGIQVRVGILFRL